MLGSVSVEDWYSIARTSSKFRSRSGFLVQSSGELCIIVVRTRHFAQNDMSIDAPTPSSHVNHDVLVTGATGLLGSAVCASLVQHGHRVRATDLRFAPNFPVRIDVGDLRDELFVHRITEGCDTVVHLGNHPNALVGLSPQRLLAENSTMNAHVFWAAHHLGVSCLVFASSIQIVLPSNNGLREQPFRLPYLPLDASAPADPGLNAYAISKEFAERHLQLLVENQPHLSATAVRFPMLPRPRWIEILQGAQSVPAGMINLGDALIQLQLPDAGELVARIVEHRMPGYHQYLPGTSIEVRNWTRRALIERYYPNCRLLRPIDEITDFADGSALVRDLDFAPKLRASVTLDKG
jgi:nucleoside-diphosphate-sugar epimerase